MEEKIGISKKELDKQYKEFVKKIDEDSDFLDNNEFPRPKKHSKFTEWLVKMLS